VTSVTLLTWSFVSSAASPKYQRYLLVSMRLSHHMVQLALPSQRHGVANVADRYKAHFQLPLKLSRLLRQFFDSKLITEAPLSYSLLVLTF